MEIFLSGESTIKDINREFKKEFPLLQLEFYKRKHARGETSVWEQEYHERAAVKEINKNFTPGMIQISPGDTVAELEQKFQKHFDLPVQVFRRTGDIYLETVQTDSLSLEKQNSLGHIAEKARFNVNTLFL